MEWDLDDSESDCSEWIIEDNKSDCDDDESEDSRSDCDSTPFSPNTARRIESEGSRGYEYEYRPRSAVIWDGEHCIPCGGYRPLHYLTGPTRTSLREPSPLRFVESADHEEQVSNDHANVKLSSVSMIPISSAESSRRIGSASTFQSSEDVLDDLRNTSERLF